MILQYDELCREALTKGADMNALFDIRAREKIGRAKMARTTTSFNADYDEIVDADEDRRSMKSLPRR